MAEFSLFKTASFINGQWVGNENAFPVINPADGSQLTLVADAGEHEALLAVEAADLAFYDWKMQSANQRSKVLMRWYELMMENIDELAKIITLEQGKPLNEAKGEIAYGASFIQWFAEEAKRVYGDTIPAPSQDKRFIVVKQPAGVVAAVTPWNFPNAMITRKAGAALAAGCTFVVKPSELTPLSALALAQLAKEAGMPDGVFNVVVGTNAKSIGEVFTQSNKVAKFTFTGSTAVGKTLLAQCASTVKRVSMELGGNAPFIVFDDADIDLAVEGAIASKFRNAGQTCVCANRFFIHSSIHDEFVDKLKRKVSALTLGNGLDEQVQLGPMISKEAAVKTHQRVTEAVEAGARLVCGGQPADFGECYYPGTILTNVTPLMSIAKCELFSPVATIINFDSEEALICMANDTEYGLAAYVYTNDLKRIWRLSEQLDFGMIGINDGMVSNVAAPFGGVKHSGMGREGSKYGIDEYLDVKHLSFGGLN